MDSLKIKLVFDRKGVANTSNKQGVIELYIYDSISRKKIYISTGIEVTAKQFKQDKGERGYIVQHPNKIAKNGQLDKIFRDIEAFALSDECRSIEDVHKWNKAEENTLSVISFIQSELKRRNPSMTVLAQNKALINQIESFARFKTFSDFTYTNVIDFDAHLKDNGLAEPTAYKRHSLLHGYIREAINRGYCTYDPYITFRPKKGKANDPVYLEEYELNAILNCKLEEKVDSDRLIKVRDTFVFQCFTGLAYVDLANFTKEDISEIDGYKVIRSNRIKTDQGFITVLLPEAIEILEKYNYQLPIISNQKYNDYLKLVAMYVTDEDNKPIISKRLTSHVARHTFGTYLVNKNVPLEVVARAMGHSNTRMTEHYAKLLGKTVVSGIVDNVFKKDKDKDKSENNDKEKDS
jgi:site-specific recombinase XerD